MYRDVKGNSGKMRGKLTKLCTCTVPGHGTSCEAARDAMGEQIPRYKEAEEWLRDVTAELAAMEADEAQADG